MSLPKIFHNLLCLNQWKREKISMEECARRKGRSRDSLRTKRRRYRPSYSAPANKHKRWVTTDLVMKRFHWLPKFQSICIVIPICPWTALQQLCNGSQSSTHCCKLLTLYRLASDQQPTAMCTGLPQYNAIIFGVHRKRQ